MQCTESLMAELLFSGETVLLCLAVLLAVVFLGVLVLDRLTRGRRRRRHRREPEGAGGRARKPFSRLGTLWGELKEMFHERSRRRRGRGRRPPTMPW
jgi:hypothetical protein